MGSQTSKTALEHKNNDNEEKGGNCHSDTSWTDIGLVDCDLTGDCLGGLGGLSEDPVSCLQCLSLPFKLCLGLLMG